MKKNSESKDNLQMESVEGNGNAESNGHVNPVDVLADEKPVPEVVVVNGTTGEKPGATGSTGSTGSGDHADSEEVAARQQARRDRKPLLLCRFFCSWPKLSFGLTLGGHIFFILVTMVLVRVGYDILPITFDRIPLDILDDVDFLRESAWIHRNDNDEIISRASTEAATTTQRERSEAKEFVELLFNLPGSGNILTKENLQKIKEVEEAFINNAEYQEKFCQLKQNGQCIKPSSLIRYFDGTHANIDSVFNDPGFDNIVQVMHAANTNPALNQGLQYHLGKSVVITASQASMKATRLLFAIGAPLAGYTNTTDNEDEQQEKVNKFMLDVFKPIGDGYFENGAGKMDFAYSSASLISVTITSLVYKDMMLVFGSLAFIIVFMILQTGSLWVTLWAVFSIVASFTCANLIYRVVLDYQYFGIFHILALFIILGIGADDVFVFFDTWKETAHHKYKSLAHRMSDCYRKAAIAMLFTSLTTAQAFIVSATSPFLGISSFGVFAGLLIFVNYVSVIVFFPVVVVTYHLGFEKYKCCCCCVKPGFGVDNEPANQEADDGKRKSRVVNFFRGRYFKFVTHKIGRWFILAFFAVLLAVCIYFASILKVNEEQIKFLKDSTNSGRYLALRSSAFQARGSGNAAEVYLVWGLEKQDLSSCHHTDQKCTGVTVWDDNFSLETANAQQKLMELCNTIRTLPDSKIDELYIQKDLNTNQAEIRCFIEDMDGFLQSQTTKDIPLSRADVKDLMNGRPSVYDTDLPQGFSNYFEVGMSYWLYNGFQPSSAGQLREYSELLGEARQQATVTKQISVPGGSYPYTYGTRMRYAAIAVNTSVEFNMGYPSGLPVRDAWEAFMEEELAKLPPALQGGFQCTPSGLWHWLRIQETLVSSAVIGIAIGLCVALPILIIATHNVLVGLLATLTICCITVSVIGVIPMAGWKLGFLESLNLVLVVGLAVDYVVHLAEGYSRSLHDDRLGRTHDMLEEVGISVLSGATTTLGAAFFMLFAQILFFTQFGVFLFSTILFSIIYALGLFVTLMGLIGPQKETGSLRPFYRWCRRTCCKKVAPHPE